MALEPESISHVPQGLSDKAVNQNGIGFRRRALFVGIGWVAALLITCPAPAGIMFLPFFPAGLLLGAEVPDKYNDAIVTCGWLLYVALCSVILSCRKRFRFYLFYSVFVCLLLTNVVGCHRILKGISNIH